MGYEVTDISGYHDTVQPDALRNDMIGRSSPRSGLHHRTGSQRSPEPGHIHKLHQLSRHRDHRSAGTGNGQTRLPKGGTKIELR